VGGFATPPDGFFGAMKELVDAQGGLFISDEVQTGWGRTGEHFWGYQAHDITPDLITFAKGLGNGLAIAGVVGRADVIDCLAANSISTFGGNPLSTAGALANLEYLLVNDLQTNAYKVGQRLKSGIVDIQSRYPMIGDVRGKGLMIGVEFVHNGSKDPDPETTAAAMEEAKSNGLLIGKGGLYGNTLRIAPPLSLTEDEADEGLDLLESAIAKATE
jgi:4-aminobutyrate aminotransferase